MLYRVPGDPKTGYDLGVGTGTYGGYVPWVRTLGTGTMRVRRGYGTGTVRGYGTWVRSVGTAYWYSVPTVPVFRKCGAISKMLNPLLLCQLLLCALPFVCWHRIGSRAMLIQDVGWNVQLHSCVLGIVDVHTSPQIEVLSASPY